MLAASELGEAFDAWRDGPEKPYIIDEEGKPQGWAAEVVDAIIVELDILRAYAPDLNIQRMLTDKMAYNTSRPPRHGRGI